MNTSVWVIALLVDGAIICSSTCSGQDSTIKGFMNSFLAQLSADTFFSKYWGRRPVVLHGNRKAMNYSHVFEFASLKDVIPSNSTSPHRLLKGTPLQYGEDLTMINMRVTNKHHVLSADAVDATFVDRTLQSMLKDGYTLVMTGLQRFWHPVLKFVSGFEQYLEWKMYGNLYITGQNNAGLPLHWDDAPVFFVQLSGQKRWKVWEPFVEAGCIHRGTGDPDMDSVLHSPITSKDREVWKSKQPLVLERTLLPGDALYIPRGFLHEGVVGASHEMSVHLSVGAVDGGLVWADFLERTPYLSLSGQPALPGKAKTASLAKFMPEALFEAKVTRGLPLDLRRDLPPRLSHKCHDENFRHIVFQKLKALDPTVSMEEIERRFQDFPLEAFADFCLSFVATANTRFLSETIANLKPKSQDIPFDRQLCVRSPVSARIAPKWDSSPNITKNNEDSLLFHTGLCGSARIQQKPHVVPGWIAPALASVLHNEENPSASFTVSDIASRVEGGAKRKNAIRSQIRQLVNLNIIESMETSVSSHSRSEL